MIFCYRHFIHLGFQNFLPPCPAMIIRHCVKGMIICIKNIESDINKKKMSDVLTRISVLKEIFYANDTIAFIFFYLRNGNADNLYANHVFFSKV